MPSVESVFILVWNISDTIVVTKGPSTSDMHVKYVQKSLKIKQIEMNMCSVYITSSTAPSAGEYMC